MKYNSRSIRKMRVPSHYEYSLKFIDDEIFNQCGNVLPRRSHYLLNDEVVIDIQEHSLGLDVHFATPSEDIWVRMYLLIKKVQSEAIYFKAYDDSFDDLILAIRKYIDHLNEALIFSNFMREMINCNNTTSDEGNSQLIGGI
ncbi:MAG: hypothetical protein COB66_05230 [Coxiella sp. (in: Bacteria)]|nr:MAG: hypothetical protein COB66_05230 [Coxiella sp. (in: g-proteobacteria)]